MKSFLTSSAFVACTMLPAQAFDVGSMTDSERADFQAEIRQYLLENPEVIMEAIGVLEQRQAEAQARADQDLVASQSEALFNDGFSWVGGNPDGDITMVEFIDYRCGYCRRAHGEVAELVASDGNIRLIVKEFPILGEDSLTSARFAVAVRMLGGADAYKSVHDELIQLRGSPSPEVLTRLGEAAGVDMEEVFPLMASAEVQAELQVTRALAQTLGVNGTPTFVVGNEILRGYLPLDAMREVVAQERAEG
ncbi:MAG: DsbA family protein [Pseudomonadota bacterium]